jgi:MFS family permease
LGSAFHDGLAGSSGLVLLSQVGLLFSVAAVVAFFAAPLWGRCADSIGRVRVFRLSMAGFAVSLLIVAGTLQAGLSDILAPTYCFAVLLGARLVVLSH